MALTFRMGYVILFYILNSDKFLPISLAFRKSKSGHILIKCPLLVLDLGVTVIDFQNLMNPVLLSVKHETCDQTVQRWHQKVIETVYAHRC